MYLLNFVWLLVGILATARVTSILYEEEIALPIRKRLGIDDLSESYPDTFLGKLFSCYWCLSVWCSLGVVIILLIFPLALLPFALSMGAILIREYTTDT